MQKPKRILSVHTSPFPRAGYQTFRFHGTSDRKNMGTGRQRRQACPTRSAPDNLAIIDHTVTENFNGNMKPPIYAISVISLYRYTCSPFSYMNIV